MIGPNHPAVRPAALGAATGARSSYALAALSWSSTPASPGLLGRLGGATARKVTGGFAIFETVGDKLPMTPSRLRPPGLVPRLALGAGTSVLVAQRDGQDPVAAARIGALAALGASAAGVLYRRWASRGDRHDLPHALVEDGLAAALALWGARP